MVLIVLAACQDLLAKSFSKSVLVSDDTIGTDFDVTGG
jgi:hypothetical protein